MPRPGVLRTATAGSPELLWAERASVDAWAGLESRAIPILRGRPATARRGGPPPYAGSEGHTGCPHPNGAAALSGLTLYGGWGCSAACGRKMAALHCLRPARPTGLQAGLRKGARFCPPRLGVGTTALAGSQRRCDSFGLDPERQEDHCILEASCPGLHSQIAP